MQDFFALNLSALQKTSPNLAKRLQDVVPNTHYEVFLGDDVLNFNIIDTRDCAPIFVDSPLTQTNQKIVEFMPYAQYPYLYCFGLGNGVFYKVLLQNEYLKCVVVIEPELEILFIVLHLLDFSQEIAESRILFLDSQSTFQDVLLIFLQDTHTKIYSKLYNLHIFNAYYDRYATLSIEFNRYFIKALEHCVISVGNDSKDAITGIAHHIANLPKMLASPSLITLIKELRTKRANQKSTAVIVSTGPSLSKQLPLLKQYQDYLTIFCIDASLPILAKEGIKPDVVFSLERVDLTARFYEETPKPCHKDVIFAITTIVHKRLADALEGDCVQWSMRPFGYTYYFGFNDYGYIGVGMSAANMAYEMVVYSKFTRCILIGQDLAFAKDGSSHAKNAVYGEREIAPKQDSQKVLLPAYGGEGMVESTNVWKLFLEFYEADIAQTPYKLEVINATEGGARIQGTIEMPFAKALESIDTSTKKQPLILTPPPLELIESNMTKAREKTREFLAFAREKKAKIEEVFLEVAGLIEDLEANKNDLENFDFTRISAALEHIESIKEFFYDKAFTTCFNDAIQSYIVHQEMEIAKIVVRIAQDDIALKAKQIDLLYAHKYWLFSLAGGIDCVIEVAQKSFSQWE
ncbi:motility associated factor glycosyltransferase family protein [Helicobacter sp.]|uniref:motility associated factor glycosyltransferase family protein n=1 Tax=Helicobacter sp. TaxID=218 RepID=UPI003753275F|nr:motility associated factor glycosyltransferase family protein [Helicobacter sp.]